jgi:hypothetical protein
MRARWLLLGFLILASYLASCSGSAPPVTLTPTLPAATPAIALPDGCAPLVQFHSTDSHGAACIAIICEDGNMARTRACSVATQAPEPLTPEQLAELRDHISRSDFFAQETYYRASADC